MVFPQYPAYTKPLYLLWFRKSDSTILVYHTSLVSLLYRSCDAPASVYQLSQVEFANVSFRPTTPLKESSATFIPTLTKMDSYSTNATRASSPSHSIPSSRSRSSSRSFKQLRKRTPSPTESITSWYAVPAYDPPYDPPKAPEPPQSDTPKEGRGLYIQFSSFRASDAPPSYTPRPQPNTSRSYIPRLRRAIANAVKDAGMESPAAAEKDNPMDFQDSSIPPPRKTSKSLFRGTYGQVMAALKDAGLTTAPYVEGEFETGM